MTSLSRTASMIARPSRVSVSSGLLSLTSSSSSQSRAHAYAQTRNRTSASSSSSTRGVSSWCRAQRPCLRAESLSLCFSSGVQTRRIHQSPVRLHGHLSRPEPGTGIKVTFKDSKGDILKSIEASEGDSLLDIAKEYDIDLEGACEGSVACSTCHVILEPEMYNKLPEPEDDENDMLDMAFGLTDTSRLGCQVKLTKELDGLVATLPSATRNMFVDRAKPTKH